MKKRTSALTEWDKIKDSNIFNSFEEFEAFFALHPNGKCFRKYTSYPWSKENFFFGTYDEFSSFQKNTTEIPFYLKDKIGSKTFNLTILSFFRDDDNKLCANCKCDCGNEVIKTYDAISKGNARSCGCNRGRTSKKESSLYDFIPDIIDAYWDYEKNCVSPKNVSISSEEEFWWKGYANSYKIPLQYMIRSASSTSFPEQTIRFFLIQNNIEVINRFLVEYKNKKYELDLFLPQFNLGIEYDGVFWHSSKIDKDCLKTQAIEETGITLVRIRENGLPKTNIKNGLEILMKEEVSNNSLANVTNQLFSYLEQLFSIKLNRIHAEDISKNKLSIQRQYSVSHLHGSVATSWLCLYWSDKNKIEPYFLPIGSSHKCWFRCPYGATFYASPNFLMSKIKEPSLEQNNDKCVFDNANMCDRAIKVQKGLKLTVLHSAFCANDVLEIKFSIENSNDVSFDPLQIWQYLVFCNDKFYSFNGALGEIERTSYAFVNQLPTETCELKYNSCCGKHDFQISPFSKNIYTVKVKLKTQFKECKLDVLISMNLLDQMNWVYKVCLHTKYHDSIMTTSGEILTWKMYDEIAQIKDSSLRHFLKEDEAKRLILEL